MIETTMFRRAPIFAVVLTLALAAGPVAAACADCCPSPEGPLVLAAAADCCGDCAETLESSPEQPSAFLRAATSVSAALVATGQPAVAPVAAQVSCPPSASIDSRSPAFWPTRALSPLRL